MASMGVKDIPDKLIAEPEVHLARTNVAEERGRFEELVEFLLDGFLKTDLQGTIAEGNRAAAQLLGIDQSELVGLRLSDFVQEEAHGEFQERLVHVHDGPLSWALRLRGSHGSIAYVLAHARVAGRDVGEPSLHWLLTDDTRARLAEQRLAAQHHVSQVLAGSGSLDEAVPGILQAIGKVLQWEVGAFWQLQHGKRQLECKTTWLAPGVDAHEFIRTTRETTFAQGIGLPGRVWERGAPAWIVDVTRDGGFSRVESASRAGVKGGFAFPVESGRTLYGVVEFFSSDKRAPDDDLLQMASGIGHQIGQFIERKRGEEGSAFLAETSALLMSSLDYVATLTRLAELAVPRLADWCAVDILDEDGMLRRLAVAHVDPAKVALAHELQRRYPPDRSSRYGIYQVMRTGEPQMLPEITNEMLEAAAHDTEHLELVRELGLCSYIAVPLTARGRTLGAISLVAAESARIFDRDDLMLAQDLAHRAAIAVDNARLFREASQFKRTLDATLDCVFMFDPNALQFFYVNQGAVDQVGYTKDELLRMTPLDIKPEYSLDSFRAMIAPLRDGSQAVHTFETIHRHKDGRDIPVEVMLQYVEPEGEAGRFVAIVRDITERKRVQKEVQDRAEQLARITQALARSNRELDQFAYVASHDLKAPLRGIANLTKWLEEDLEHALTDETRHQMELLQGRVRRMESLIDGILQYSRVGRMKNRVEQVNIGELLDDVIDLLAPPASFTIDVSPDMPVLLTPRSLLEQVFMNLIGNAIKHHHRLDGRIEVTAQERGAFYEFVVSDDGPGIASQYHDRIFVIFQTLQARDQVEGTGVGLSLVKKIVEYQGGGITLESEEGQGATFRFTWPRRAREG
jgi:PAS domain S-box-containing protein